MFTSDRRPDFTRRSRPMFTTHRRPVFTTVAQSLLGKNILGEQKTWSENT